MPTYLRLFPQLTCVYLRLRFATLVGLFDCVVVFSKLSPLDKNLSNADFAEDITGLCQESVALLGFSETSFEFEILVSCSGLFSSLFSTVAILSKN